MTKETTHQSRRFGLRLASHARTLLAVSALAALAVPSQSLAQPITPVTTISAPVISVPASITTDATSSAGATVNFSATATSNVSSEIFRRTTASGEAWNAYTVTFRPTISGNFKLRFRTVADNGFDNTFYLDNVHVIANASNTELFASGFERPTISGAAYVSWDWQNTGRLFADVLAGDWTFTNYAGFVAGGSGAWDGPSGPQEGNQRGFIQAFYGTYGNVTSATAFPLVAGEIYTVKFYQASRRSYGGAVTYAVTLESMETNSVTATPTSGSTFPAGTTPVILSATNSAGATSTASFNVTVNAVSRVAARVSLSNLSQTYDGTAKSVTASTVPAGLAVTINYLGNNTNAGSCRVQAIINDFPYEGSTLDTLVIAKANATVTVTPYNVEYDGLPHSAAVTIAGVHGETGATVGTVALSSTHTAVGIYPDSWSFTGAANYNNIATTTITDTIKDTTAPVITATMTARGGGDDESTQFFTLVFSATDLVGVKTLTAVLNGVTVTNGQVVQLQLAKSGKQESEKEGSKLKIKATSFALVVTAKDAAGNTSTKTIVPVFVKNGKDDDDKKGDDKKGEDKKDSDSKGSDDKKGS